MIRRFALAGLSLTLATSAMAKDAAKDANDKPRAVADKPQVALDPAKAYVAFTAGKDGASLMLLRTPTPTDLAAYAKRRADALDDAKRRYARDVKRWEDRVKGNGTTYGQKPGPRPVEPDWSTFAIAPIELGLMVPLGPFNRFAKSEQQSVYLHAVPPGEYTLYGPIAQGPQGAMMGTCLCMGSIGFDATSGTITNLGRVHLPFFEARQRPESGTPKPRTEFDLPAGTTTFAVDPALPGATIDPRIGAFPVKAATYRAKGKLPNWMGLAIDRITAIPGVIGYDRDRILAAGEAVGPAR